MIVVEVVDDLSVLDVAVVNVTSLSSPLKVVELRVNILVLKPALLEESPSQLMVASLDDVHLLVVPASVSLLPSRHVDIVLPILLLLFLFPAIHVYIVTILYLRLFR
jgi:hypothetical protein